MRRQFAGRHGVIQRVLESRHSQTLDKYLLRVDGLDDESDVEMWDIELKAPDGAR
jgi:hypothetical protein